MIVQWSPRSPWSPQSSDSVQVNQSMIAKGSNLSTNAQWMLNERSMNAQRALNECSMNAPGALNDLIDLSMISQRIFTERQIVPPQRYIWLRDERAHKDLPQKRFLSCFRRSLRDQVNFEHPAISVLCKGKSIMLIIMIYLSLGWSTIFLFLFLLFWSFCDEFIYPAHNG